MPHDGTIRLWDVGAYLQFGAPITGDTGPLYSVAFSPDGTTVAAGSYGDWAAEDPNGPVGCNGGGWYSCTSGNINHPNTRPTTSLWDADKRTLLAGHQASHFGVVHSVAFSPDGTMVAAGGHDTATDHDDYGRMSLFQGGQ